MKRPAPAPTPAAVVDPLVLPLELRERLRAAITAEGELAVCQRMSLGHTAIARLVAGLPSRRATVALVTLHLNMEAKK